ncbi:MAG: hypothetical protein ABSG25_11670 [Bryobacteraceae bacterium]
MNINNLTLAKGLIAHKGSCNLYAANICNKNNRCIFNKQSPDICNQDLIYEEAYKFVHNKQKKLELLNNL